MKYNQIKNIIAQKTETKTSTKSSASNGKLKTKSDAADSLRDFLIDGLKDLY